MKLLRSTICFHSLCVFRYEDMIDFVEENTWKCMTMDDVQNDIKGCMIFVLVSVSHAFHSMPIISLSIYFNNPFLFLFRSISILFGAKKMSLQLFFFVTRNKCFFFSFLLALLLNI